MSRAKRFEKGTTVRVRLSTYVDCWTDAEYLGTMTRRIGWHTALVTMAGGSQYRAQVPARRIRPKHPK